MLAFFLTLLAADLTTHLFTIVSMSSGAMACLSNTIADTVNHMVPPRMFRASFHHQGDMTNLAALEAFNVLLLV